MLIPISSACSWIAFRPWAGELCRFAQLLASVPSTGPGVNRAGAARISSNGTIFLLWLPWLDF